MYAIRSIGISKMISTFDTVSLFHITAPFSILNRINVMFQTFILIFFTRLGLMRNRQILIIIRCCCINISRMPDLTAGTLFTLEKVSAIPLLSRFFRQSYPSFIFTPGCPGVLSLLATRCRAVTHLNALGF